MGLEISVGGPNNEVVSGGLSYTRKGVYTYTMVYGAQRRIETSMATASLTSNVVLDENWNTLIPWDLTLAKTQRTKYQDHFRRYSINPLSLKLETIDVLRVVASADKSPRGFREFEANLTKLITPTPDAVNLTAYADIEVGSNWQQVEGITVQVDNNANVPSVLFNASIETKEKTKAYKKAVTITMVSLGSPYTDNYVLGSSAETDYIPFLVMKKDRFRSTVARKSYRDTPSGAVTDGVGIDSDADLTQFGNNISDTFGRIMSGGRTSLIGSSSLKVGDSITAINIYYEGAYVVKSVDLRVVSRSYSFPTDTTSIGFGRP